MSPHTRVPGQPKQKIRKIKKERWPKKQQDKKDERYVAIEQSE